MSDAPPRSRGIAGLLRRLVRGYQILVSPLAGGHCRYVPSCSAYCDEALARHGAVKGSWLALRRIVRCHPFGGSGFDPVPREDADDPVGTRR